MLDYYCLDTSATTFWFLKTYLHNTNFTNKIEVRQQKTNLQIMIHDSRSNE